MSFPSAETQMRIAELRQKALAGNLTLEETKEAIAFLRQERVAQPPSSSGSKKAAAAAVNVDNLLGELGI